METCRFCGHNDHGDEACPACIPVAGNCDGGYNVRAEESTHQDDKGNPTFPGHREVDITPTWLGVLPAMLEVIRHGRSANANLDALAHVEEEFKKMAGLADAHRETIKQGRDMAVQLQQAVVELGMSDPEADVEAIGRIERVIERLR